MKHDWDFFGLFGKGQQEEYIRGFQEELSQIVETPQIEITEDQPEVPETEGTQIVTTDVATPKDVTTEESSVTTFIKEAVPQVVGGALDMAENTTRWFTKDFENQKLVFNIPGLSNYDSKYPNVFFMEDQEFDDLYDKGKISYLPKIADAKTPAGEFTREISKALAGIYAGGNLLRGGKALTVGYGSTIATTGALSTNVAAGKAIKLLGPGVIGSLMAYKPHTPRLANSLQEFVNNTPFQITEPFFKWLSAEDNNTEAEERFKIALESILVDFATAGAGKALGKAYNTVNPEVSKFFKEKVFQVFKRERELMKAEMRGLSQEEIQTLDDTLLDQIDEVTEAVAEQLEVPVNVEPVPASQVFDEGVIGVRPVVQDTAEDLLTEFARETSDEVFADITQEATHSVWRYSSPNQPAIFNTSKVQELGARKSLNIIGERLEEEFKRKRPESPFGPKSLKEIEEAGINTADAAELARVRSVISSTAEDLGLDSDLLYKMMKKDLNDVVGLESRIFAYRTMLAQMGNEFDTMILSAVNDPTDLVKTAAAFNKWQDIQEVLQVFSELRRTTARATTGQRISIPNRKSATEGLTPEQMAKLSKELKGKGVDHKLLEVLYEASQLSSNPLTKIRNAKEIERTFAQKGWDAVVELYRGMILSSVKTHITNTASGVLETFITPMNTLVGSGLRGDTQTMKEMGGFVTGLSLNMWQSAKWATRAIIDERNFLDPAGTKLDSSLATRGHAISMNYIDPNKPIWSPINWATLAVNTTGKIARGSLRVLGGEDEFFKQWNYRAKAYQKIVANMPNSIKTKAQRKDYIASEMEKYFDPKTGQATNKEALRYAQEITFTEDLEAGTLVKQLYNASQNSPWLKLIFPFVRTPVNIWKRYLERTPGVNLFLQKTKDKLNSGDPEAIAQVYGNMALGVTLYGSAISAIMSGNITGGGPTNVDQKKLWLAAGNQPYSIKVGNEWVSYNRFDPSATPFALLADMYENGWKYSDGEVDSIIGGAIVGFMQGVTNRTWLQSFKRFMDAFDVAYGSDSTGSVSKLTGQYVSGFIPPVLNEVYDIINEPAGFSETRNFMEKISAKARPLTGYDAVKHNWITGAPIVQPYGYNTGIPVHKGDPDPYIEELVKMGSVIKPPATSIGNVKLTGKQYAELCRLIGTIEAKGITKKDDGTVEANVTKVNGLTLYESLKAVMDSPQFDKRPNKRYYEGYQADDPNVMLVKEIINAYKNAGLAQLKLTDKSLMQRIIEDQENALSINIGSKPLFDVNR